MNKNKLLELRQRSEDTSLSIQERIRTLFELSDYERGPDVAVILRKIRNLYELENTTGQSVDERGWIG